MSFTGQNSDTNAGLYDFTFREYSPSQGRWVSPDPAGADAADPTTPQSWNRYAYVLNNPMSAIDLEGQDCVYDEGGGDIFVKSGDCYSSSDNGYYVDCDGCIAGAQAVTPFFDPVTGALYFQDASGNSITDANGNGITIEGFAEAIGLHDSVTVTATDPSGPGPIQVYLGSLLSLKDTVTTTKGAWKNGYFGCVFSGGRNETSGKAVATKVAEKVAAETALSRKAATYVARAKFGLTDGRFTAWGKYSKVLVPRAAANIAPWLARANVAAWVYTDAQLARGLTKCSPSGATH